jgi:pimeloyl-ACP methyl ester carboxylesterase
MNEILGAVSGNLTKICADLCMYSYDYSPDSKKVENETLRLVGADAKDFSWFDVTETDTQALIVTAGDTHYLAFQGTNNTVDLFTDAYCELVPYLTGHCHSAFMRAARLSYSAIAGELKKRLKDNPKSTAILTGHSLGGALAMLYVALLKSDDRSIPIDNLITFGQPRCGNIEFAIEFNSLEVNYVRFMNNSDLVPILPPPFHKNKWTHGGQGLRFDKNGLLREPPITDETALWWRLVVAVMSAWFSWSKRKKFDKELFEEYSSSMKHSMKYYRENLLKYLKLQNG